MADFWDSVGGMMQKVGGSLPGPMGAAAGIAGGIISGDAFEEEQQQQLPPYEKFNYDQEAFTGNAGERMARGAEGSILRGQMGDLATRDIGRENAGMFQEALGLQRDAAMGRAPSVAELQMRDAMGRAAQQQQSAAGSARGAGSLALAQMNASNQIAGIQQNAATQGAILRAKEMEAARAGMFGAISADRETSIAGQAAKARAIQGYGQSLDQRFEGDRNRGMAFQGALRGEHAAAQGREFTNTQAGMAADALEKKAEADKQMAGQQNMVNAGMAAGKFISDDEDRKVRLKQIQAQGQK